MRDADRHLSLYRTGSDSRTMEKETMGIETKKTIAEWSLDRLCIDYPDYFQGAGADGYDEVFVGVGRSEKEAADDAAEQAAMCGLDIPPELEKEISELSSEDEIEEIECDAHLYFAIRVNLAETEGQP